jgi:hypothetical protein
MNLFSEKTALQSITLWGFVPLFLFVTGCQKETTAPVVGPPITTATIKSPPPPQTMSGDTLCGFPFKISPAFNPTGFYTGAETTVTVKDTCPDGPTAYPGQCTKIAYTYNGGYWGAGFINNNSWNAKYKIASTVKKLTCSLYGNGTVNVTLLPFGTDVYGKFELYKTSSNVNATYKWTKVSIPLSGSPASFAMACGIVIDGNYPLPNGTVSTIYLKDFQFE